MTGLQSSSPLSPCGTWSAFFADIAPSPIATNIPMIECFRICSKVAEFAGLMSRRQITERQTMPLPSLKPDRYHGRVIFDSSQPIRQSVHRTATTQTGQATDAAGAELIEANGLFASLVFQQIRPRNRSAADAKGQSCSSDEPQLGCTAVSLRDVQWPSSRRSDSPDSLPVPIETLFSELARRRLRSLAAKERPE